jgi:hypothetical protein
MQVSVSQSGLMENFGLLEGLKAQGIDFIVGSRRPTTRVVICWGWRKGEEYRAKGHDVLVFERGYLGDRFKWTSIGWNGLNGRADFCLPENLDESRFDDNFTLKPWKKDGDYIVIMGQVMGDMSLMGQNLTSFYEESAKKLREIHQKDVFFRPHPHTKRANFSPNIPVLNGSLEESLDGAMLTVAYNSNTGVDSVVNGVPNLSFDCGSMAYEVTGHEYSDIITPNRRKWALKLAHCQYTPDEIASGQFWERLKCKLEN